MHFKVSFLAIAAILLITPMANARLGDDSKKLKERYDKLLNSYKGKDGAQNYHFVHNQWLIMVKMHEGKAVRMTYTKYDEARKNKIMIDEAEILAIANRNVNGQWFFVDEMNDAKVYHLKEDKQKVSVYYTKDRYFSVIDMNGIDKLKKQQAEKSLEGL